MPVDDRPRCEWAGADPLTVAHHDLEAAGTLFVEHLWSFVGGRPIQNAWAGLGQIPAETAESRAMSKDLKRRRFSFVGPTVCYAFMQAAGLVNDHTPDCFRYAEVAALG